MDNLTYDTGSLAGDLAKAKSLTINPQPTNPSQGQPVVIQPPQTTGATPLTLPQPIGDTTQASSTVAGATQTSNDLQKYLDQLQAPTTALDTQNKTLSDTLNSLYGLDTGKAKATAQAETDAGLPDLKKQLADINSQILTKNAEYEKMFSSLDTQPGVTTAVAVAEQNGLRRSQAADIGLLQARALGMQGQIQSAQDAVSRAINLKYQSIEEEITAKEKQLALIQPMLSQQQQKVANAQQLMLNDQKDKIAEQKSIQTANVNYAISNKIQEPYFYRGNVLVKTSDGTPMFENQGGTLIRLSDGKRYENSAQFFADAGINNWSQIHTVTNSTAVKFETRQIGSGKSAINVRYGYDTQGNLVSALNLSTGQPINFNGNGNITTSSSSGSGGGNNGTSSSQPSVGNLSPIPKTASANNLRNWVASNWHKLAGSMAYYDVWGQVADAMRRAGIDPSTPANDKLLWDVFRPGEYGQGSDSKRST